MNEPLMAAVPFSSDDLAANKQGYVTEEQKVRVEGEFVQAEGSGKKLTYGLWAAAILLVVLVFAVGPPVELTARFTRAAVRRQPDTLRWAVFGLGVAALIAAGISSLFVLVAGIGRRNMRSHLPVLTVAGIVEKSQLEQWHTVKIADREFVFSAPDLDVYNAFEEGRFYSIYYIFNTSNIILSAERA